jgi:hypothetical protein
MPSNVSIVSSDVPSDAQPITMTAGDTIAKDQLLVLTPSRRVTPARPALGQSLLTRAVDTPLQTSIFTLNKATGIGQDYQQSLIERNYITPAGNVVIFSYDANSPRSYCWNLFSPDGVLLNQAIYTTTNAQVGAYARKVDSNRFMIAWVVDGAGAEQSTFRYIIYNNDGTLSQALTTVVLASGPLRNTNNAMEVFAQDFIVTSDGYIVVAYSLNDSSFNFVSWTLAGTVRAIATNFQNFKGVKPEMAESFGAIFCKVYENQNGVTRYWKFNHSVAGSNPAISLGANGGAPSPRNCMPGIVAMKNGNVLVCEKSNTTPFIWLWDGTTLNNLSLGLSVGTPSNAVQSIHDLGDGEAMALIPVTNDGNFVAIRVDQTGKIRASGTITMTFTGSSTYGWDSARFFKSPDSIVFIFADYNASGTPGGTYNRAATLPLGWPFGGDVLASLGTIVNLTSGPTLVHRHHVEWYAQGELRMLVNSENGTYPQQIRIINARKSSIIGVAAAAAAKDAQITLKTKGAFVLASDQDFGDGFAFSSAAQGVVGTGGKVVGRNAVLGGLLT